MSDRLLVAPDGSRIADAPTPRFLLPGSFDPLHDGHRGMFEAAARRLGPGGAFELSVTNAEKPPLGDDEIERRAAAFAGYQHLWLTRAPTFVEKARLFPGAVFVVGADTAARIVQPRFYGGSEERMRLALGEIRAAGCRFLVAGRADGGGRFVDRDGLGLGEEVADLFEAIAEAEFRLDVSSTVLRASGAPTSRVDVLDVTPPSPDFIRANPTDRPTDSDRVEDSRQSEAEGG